MYVVQSCGHPQQIKFDRAELDLEQGEPFSFKAEQWQALNKVYEQDIKEMKEAFAKLDESGRLDNTDEMTSWGKPLTEVTEEQFYIAANLKFIEEAFYFIRCETCKQIVALYVISQ